MSFQMLVCALEASNDSLYERMMVGVKMLGEDTVLGDGCGGLSYRVIVPGRLVQHVNAVQPGMRDKQEPAENDE